MMFSRGAYGIGRCFAGGYIGPWHMLIAAGFVIGIVALIFMLVQKKKNNGNDDDLLAMLKERFVRGEITEEEYTTKRNALTRR